MSTEKKGFPWIPVALGAGALLALGLASKSHAEQQPLEAWEDPTLSHEQAAQAMRDELLALLHAKGLDEGTPIYETATARTSMIVDKRNTAAKIVPTQAQQEAYMHFMWPTNALLIYHNFDTTQGLTWPQYITKYQDAKAVIAAL